MKRLSPFFTLVALVLSIAVIAMNWKIHTDLNRSFKQVEEWREQLRLQRMQLDDWKRELGGYNAHL